MLKVFLAFIISVPSVQAKVCGNIFAQTNRHSYGQPSSPLLHYKISEKSSKFKKSKGNALLLHGLGDDLTQLNALSRQLVEAGYNVLRIDLHGHGKNLNRHQSAKEIIHFEENVKDVVRVVEESAFKNPIVIGHSYGAAIGFAAGNLLRNNTNYKPSALIMMSPYLRRLDHSLLTGNPFVDAQMEYLSETFMRQTFKEYFISKGVDRIDVRVEVAIATTKGIRDFDILSLNRKSSPSFDISLLVMAGSKDHIVPVHDILSYKRKLDKEGFQSVEVRTVTGDHFFPHHNSAETGRAILDFLEDK